MPGTGGGRNPNSNTLHRKGPPAARGRGAGRGHTTRKPTSVSLAPKGGGRGQGTPTTDPTHRYWDQMDSGKGKDLHGFKTASAALAEQKAAAKPLQATTPKDKVQQQPQNAGADQPKTVTPGTKTPASSSSAQNTGTPKSGNQDNSNKSTNNKPPGGHNNTAEAAKTTNNNAAKAAQASAAGGSSNHNETTKDTNNEGTAKDTTSDDEFGAPPVLSPSTAEKIDAASKQAIDATTTDTAKPRSFDLTDSTDGDDSGKPPHNPFFIPEDKFRFNRSDNQEASTWALKKLNNESDLNKVAKTLAPQAQMLTKVTSLQREMHGATMAYTNAVRNFKTIEADNDFVHKCVRVNPLYHIPSGADRYPLTFLPLYKNVQDSLADSADKFRKEATAIIHKGHRAYCLQLKLDRVKLLFHHLIHELGQFHAAMYRALHLNPNPPQKPGDGLDDVTIATKAVRQLLIHVDLELLEYLDMNRSNLIEIFENEYPQAIPKLCTYDHDTAASVTKKTILSYLKPATCLHYRKQLETGLKTAALAAVTAKMEHAKATAALAATEAALQKQADALPKDAKTLHDVVIKTVDKRLQQRAHGKSGNNKTTHSDKKRPSTALHKPPSNNKRPKTNPKTPAIEESPPPHGRKLTGKNTQRKNKRLTRPSTAKDPPSSKTSATKQPPSNNNSSKTNDPSTKPNRSATNNKDRCRTDFRAKIKAKTKQRKTTGN
jgi:hypothetical protein